MFEMACTGFTAETIQYVRKNSEVLVFL